MILAIHQPNFFPWWPYFEKIEQADMFVFLTHCQFEKNGYQNRFNHNDNWYTMSVKRGMKPISEKEYLNPIKDWDRIKSNLNEHRDFIVAGFDVEGGYHPIFIGAGHEDGVEGFNGQGTAAQPQGYHADYAQSVKWADYYQARFRHINELSEEELNDLGI